ncbi:hypothetical protein A2960_04855 [Candidatus Gottesmanbacteria bacterium RIFCSPLOWO2_01_FULL_39_12b]|uniref:Uncharacterized protein n=1 Tax=Candidatus Gottesmanbacteria bacterium RIFCSPLOWO2_01_FULL_39_12b TaxID=1798388 RepID=A0A1F6APR0_9BACT|nr:MAG: hypothetical protein A2960_04855 [Candidatus Gottesmanbacteria bacterium RIFCSPLOWO2_01_FULL_39_12b]
MFKNIIAPAQAWLLSQGRCVGCSTPLRNGLKENKKEAEVRVTCKKCGRIYIHNQETKRFQRAPLT